jgi:integrase
MALKKRGEKWLATVFRGYEPQADGRVKRLEHARSFGLKKDAERWLREQAELVDRGTWVKPCETTLRDYLKQWREGALALGPQRERTKHSYRELLATYIEPKLGGVRLDRLTKSVVQRAAAELLAQPRTSGGKPIATTDGVAAPTLSPITVRRALVALGVALRDAVEQRLITLNPAIGIALPRAKRHVPVWLNREQVRTLIDGTANDRHGPLWALVATTGVRPSEALGLQWDCADLAAAVIRIRQSLAPQNKATTGRVWKLDDPKTARSRRAIPIASELVTALKRHRAKQAAERLAAGEHYAEHGQGGFVFGHPNGEPYREDALMQLFRRTLSRLKLPAVTLYSLRHGHASLLLEAGVPLKVVSERLGHSSIQLTADTYSHVSDQLQRRAVEQFESYMNVAEAAR